MQTAAVTINWATILPLLIPVFYALIPLVVAWVGVAAKSYLDAHTSGTIQTVLEKITATVVQSVEQTFSNQDSGPATSKAKFDAAATALGKNAFDQLGITLSDTQIKTLIESAVHVLNQGASVLVPGVAPLVPLTPGESTASTALNPDQFKRDVLDGVTQAVPGIVQDTLGRLLGQAISSNVRQSTTPAQQTVGQVSPSAQADVVVQPGVTVGLAGHPTAAQGAATPQPPAQS